MKYAGSRTATHRFPALARPRRRMPSFSYDFDLEIELAFLIATGQTSILEET
jgi:hypothetical protein